MYPLQAGVDDCCNWGGILVFVVLLQGGKWNDEQILPPGWVEYSTTPTNAFNGYGAGWWLQFPGKASHGLTDSLCAVACYRRKEDLSCFQLSPQLRALQTDHINGQSGLFLQHNTKCTCTDMSYASWRTCMHPHKPSYL